MYWIENIYLWIQVSDKLIAVLARPFVWISRQMETVDGWNFYFFLCDFLLRNAMQAQPMSSCIVCPYVCPSVTFVNSVKTSNHIFKKFLLSGSYTILVFPYQTSWQYSDVDSLPKGGVKCRWGRHKSRFWVNSRLHRVLWTLDHQVQYTRSCDGSRQVDDTDKRRILLMAGDNDVFMTRSLNVTPKIAEQHLILRSGKSEA